MTSARRFFAGLLSAICFAFPLGAELFSAPHAAAEPITIRDTDAGNLVIDEQTDPDHVIVKLATPAHDWFAGTFDNLLTDRETTIGLQMKGNDTRGNPANVAKWQDLKPVMTYADPTKYETYEWFRKDADGRWVSGDPFKTGEAKYAGTNKLPAQQIIPEKLADQFLSADGIYWCPWRDILATQAITSINTFRINQQFTASTASVAMRVPFTYTYLQLFLQRLQDAKLPDVYIDEIGKTAGGRKLQAIRLVDPETNGKTPETKTIVVIAREHATEHASSWALYGMISRLLGADKEMQQYRKNLTWIFIPIEDPDGSVTSQFDRLTELFYNINNKAIQSELLAYARYFSDYYYAGNTIDLSLALHNVECKEGENILNPYSDLAFLATVTAVNKKVFSAAQKEKYQTGNPEKGWEEGRRQVFRLYGWCAESFNTLDLVYEVNDRYPQQRLTLQQQQRLGALIAEQLSQWLASEDGKQWHTDRQKYRDLKVLEREAYFMKYGRTPESRTPYELVKKAY